MQLKELQSKAGSLTDYLGQILFLLFWNSLNNIVLVELPGTATGTLISLGTSLFIGPLIYAGIFGSIDQQQDTTDAAYTTGIIDIIRTHYLRLLGATFLSVIFYFAVLLISSFIGSVQQPLDDNPTFLTLFSSFLSILNLIWFSAIITEKRVFRGLRSALNGLFTNPITIIVVIIWGIFVSADTLLFDFQTDPISVYINIARGGVFAVLRVGAIMYLLPIYRGLSPAQDDSVDEIFHFDAEESPPAEPFVKSSFVFAFLSFIPLLHFVSLILGIVAQKRTQRFVVRAAIATCTGAFFSFLYILFVLGMLGIIPNRPTIPDISFITRSNPELSPYIYIDEYGYYDIDLEHLESYLLTHPDHHWSYDAASAMTKYDVNDMEGALADFYSGLQKNPEPSDFYFYYGIALLDYGQYDLALDQFQLAIEREPDQDLYKQYASLIETAYTPSILVSSIIFIIILLLLFTFHEYGHAYAAWKLGDDTAKDLGRLTLNPVPHLDLVGSILLPGFLLFQQAEVIFGWAKPVPVNRENFQNPKKDHMRVAFAGPAVNLMITMACAVFLSLLILFIRLIWPETISLNLSDPFATTSLVGPTYARPLTILIVVIKQLMYTSLILGIFNLLPIPPLDGSWILIGILPEGAANFFEKARRFSYIIFLLIVLTPIVDYFISTPLGLAWVGLDFVFTAMGFF